VRGKVENRYADRIEKLYEAGAREIVNDDNLAALS
jgi:long-chain acyl-CoA synthetase